MDVSEPASGYRYVLRKYLDMAVDHGSLAVQAGPGPGGDICREAFPHVPGSYEAAGGAHTWVSSAVQVVKNLPTEVPGDQGAERPRGGIPQEVEVAELLCEDAKPRTGAEGLYLRAEDLAERHVAEVERGFVGDGSAAKGSCGSGDAGE